MSMDLKNKLVIGISSRALFDSEAENKIYEEQGLDAYIKYQVEHEKDILKPGTAFPLIKALHNLNVGDERLVEIIIMSKNSADTSLRIFNSIKYYGLDITRAALVDGSKIAPYLNAFSTDLFLSANKEDVQEAIDGGIAAGLICGHDNLSISPDETVDQIRIAFDGDAVIFSDESELIYKSQGLKAFDEHETENALNPMAEGPFAKLLRMISMVQSQFKGKKVPIRTALITARCAPAHERVIRTLRAWNVRIDESFFLGGVPKADVLHAFGAHIFFDDQFAHTDTASKLVPAAWVPLKSK